MRLPPSTSWSAQIRRAMPRLEELEPRLAPANDIFIVPGGLGVPANVPFAWLVSEAVFRNEIGVFSVDDAAGSVDGFLPGETGYAQAALSRGQTVFRNGQGAGLNNGLTFLGGEMLAFYLVQNNSATAVLRSNPLNVVGQGPLAFFSIDGANPDRFEHVLSSAQPDGGLRLRFEDLTNGGDRDFNDALVIAGGTGLFTTPGARGQTVAASFIQRLRHSAFHNEIGLFQVDDALGSVNGLLPGTPGYAQAALNDPTRQIIFRAGQEAGAANTLNLAAGERFALYLVQNGTTEQFLQSNPSNDAAGLPRVFFSLLAANPDLMAHLDWTSPSEFAFEDLFGGGDRDFNDAVASISFGAPQGTPTSDATPPDITARLLTDTFDPARVTPPNDTANDTITSEYAITGTVLDDNQIVSFRAGLDGDPVVSNVLDTLLANGSFILDRSRLNAINGGPLTDGEHVLMLQATDEFGNTSLVFNFEFTVDSVAAATLLLDPAFDTGTLGEFRTDFTSVRLTGQTEAGATVRLVRNTTGGPVNLGTTSADAAGLFSFSTVSLDAGPNGLKVFATDAAGNIGESGATLTRNTAPTVAQPIGVVSVPTNAGPSTFNLASVFGDVDNTNPIVRYDTVLGTLQVQLFPTRAPLHVANFLNYVNDGDYDTTFIHRSVPGFVIQGGGFEFLAGQNPNFTAVPKDAAVTNEFFLPNSRGTLALAKSENQPNSGTSEWFFSIADNVAELDNQNGGFTVYGQVVGGGNLVLDAIATVPRFALTPFQTIPLRNFNGTSIQQAGANNFILMNDVFRVADPLSYSLVSNSNPGLVNPTFNGSQLQLSYTPNASGSATIVLRAQDPDGSAVQHTFTVQVGQAGG